MNDLINKAWNIHDNLATKEYLVKPSIPILYFGNRARYQASTFKVITVGLNPSDAEFPASGPDRFSAASAQKGKPATKGDRAAYLRALDEYFDGTSAYGWFAGSFEGVLEGMDASYSAKRANTALHTDLCSPVATRPTWSGLAKHHADLIGPGVELWHDLVRELKPDVIIASVARGHLSRITFPALSVWEPIQAITTMKNGAPRKRPYVIEGRDIDLGNGSRSTLIFGQAAQRPFGTLSNRHRIEAGQSIMRHYNGR